MGKRVSRRTFLRAVTLFEVAPRQVIEGALDMAAKITLTPASAAPSATITVAGTGFGWRWWATVTLSGAEVAKVQCSTSGAFTATFVVPPGSGAKVVKAKTYWRSAQATLTVTGVPVPPPPPPVTPPPSNVALDTRRDGWGLWRGVYVKGDPGFGLDSAFDATKTAIPTNTQMLLTDLSQVSSLPGGGIRITAERKAGQTGGRAFASACIGTRTTFAQRYGLFEARMKLPLGWAAFPAFWMLAAPSLLTPPENDIMEAYTGGTWDGGGPRSVTHTLWFRDEDDGSEGGAYEHAKLPTGLDYTQAFHTFGCDWRANLMRYFVDGVETWRVDDPSVIPDMSHYPILNLAVGAPTYRADSRTPASMVMDVEWVRVSP